MIRTVQSFPYRQDHLEVCTLSGRVSPALRPALSALLPGGLRFFQTLLPATPSPFLAVGIPSVMGRIGFTQLTTEEMQTSEVGACPPVALRMSPDAEVSPGLATYRFGHSVSASSRCFPLTRFIGSSLSFNRLVFSLALGRLRLAAFGTLFLGLRTSALAFARPGRDTWTSQGLLCFLHRNTPLRPLFGRRLVRVASILVANP